MTTTFDDWWKTVATTVRPPTLNESARVVWEAATLSERERCAAICDARSADHWRAYSDKSSPHFCDARFEAFSDESEECAKLIRGDNVEVTGKPPRGAAGAR